MPKTRTATFVLALVALAVPGFAAEGEDHAARQQKVIAIGQSRLVPNELHMKADEVLSMQNHSTRLVKVTFLEPKDLGERVKCTQVTRLSEDEAMVAGSVFRRQGDQVVGFIAPGMFVSVCSLSPGTYVFTAVPVDRSAAPADEHFALKGQIVVE